MFGSLFCKRSPKLLNVDGRIVIVALYQSHVAGVRAEFPRFHRSLVPLRGRDCGAIVPRAGFVIENGGEQWFLPPC